MSKTVPELLREGANTYEERNKLYGDNYKKFGAIMVVLFPNGPPPLRTVADWNRFGVFFQIASKVTRYAESFDRGGHADSAHDAMVYSGMLEELTEEAPAGAEIAVSLGETPISEALRAILTGWERVPGVPEAVMRLRSALASPVGTLSASDREAIRLALRSLGQDA